MSGISGSNSESNHFVFFEEYDDKRFDAFVDVALRVLKSKEEGRELDPCSGKKEEKGTDLFFGKRTK
ncbi:hypothetical protein [Pseudomonas sp. S1_E04]